MPLRFSAPAALRLAALALVLVGLTANFAGYPLLDPDEGRNASIAREMAERGDFVLPRLNGLPYGDKPALYFATVAASIQAFGATEFAARLPSLVFTLGTLTLVAWFGGRMFGPAASWVAVVATGATPLTLAFARTVIFDAALAFFVTAALVAFYEAVEQRDRGWVWSVLAWAAIGLGILTKGPIALALPLMIAVPYAVWRRASRVIWSPAGPLTCAAIVMPWLLAVSGEMPDLVEYALFTETFERLLTDRRHRTGPVWYFLPIMLAGTLPWSVLIVSGWRRQRPLHLPDGARDRRTLFLLLWILVPLVFFSLSQSKRPQYLVPLVPAVGLLAARLWRGHWLGSGRGTAATLVVIGAVLAAAPLLVPLLLEVSPGIEAAVPTAALWLGGTTAVAGVLLWRWRGRRDMALVTLALPIALIPLSSRALMREIGRDRSAADLARAIAVELEPGSQVLAVRAFPLSLSYYLERPVLLATDSGRELTSTYVASRIERWRNAPRSPLRSADWWRDAVHDCRARVFVTRADDHDTRTVLAARLPLLVETRSHAAYGPCGWATLASG